MNDVGRLHNTALSKVVLEHPEWVKGILPSFNTQGATIKVNGIRLNDSPGEWQQLSNMTRSYFRQYILDSMPQFTVPMNFFDSITTTMAPEYYMNPDSAILDRLSSQIYPTPNYYFFYLTEQLFNAITNVSSVEGFNNTVDALLDNADYNLTDDTEFYIFAVAVAVAKGSMAYWTDDATISTWNNLADYAEGMSSVRPKINVMSGSWRNETRTMIAADVAGAIAGGFAGSVFGSIGGPAGSLGGVVIGGLYQGVSSSFRAGAWSLAKRMFGW